MYESGRGRGTEDLNFDQVRVGDGGGGDQHPRDLDGRSRAGVSRSRMPSAAFTLLCSCRDRLDACAARGKRCDPAGMQSRNQAWQSHRPRYGHGSI